MAMPGMDPRAMAAAMKRMGIDVRDIPDVEEVVVRTADKEYRFRRAQVSVMKAQGQETWTIVGKPETLPRTATAAPSNMTPGGVGVPLPSMPAPLPETYQPTGEDIRTVMDAAHCSEAAARKALAETDGDLAQAILNLA